MKNKRLRIGVATSVSKEHWQKAELYPNNTNNSILLSDEQKSKLALFH
ncbi:hypothetical protein BD31_I0768 [Candidatus Nitrosopumilus salaria BD31]|uniref:Uncharacterized protein n=1 Tax=Candidatus Nitrosopumilus salarius BD31 TaxID=859350 RepID=I3CZX1_9ARCH|nr:hypothetical protein [Candidatus Nitrosopumilus salaria]EIJ65014.1 hypothetical protein BD31_I0768 [Candidatus Nitrosopumilus salaria BD31]